MREKDCNRFSESLNIALENYREQEPYRDIVAAVTGFWDIIKGVLSDGKMVKKIHKTKWKIREAIICYFWEKYWWTNPDKTSKIFIPFDGLKWKEVTNISDEEINFSFYDQSTSKFVNLQISPLDILTIWGEEPEKITWPKNPWVKEEQEEQDHITSYFKITYNETEYSITYENLYDLLTKLFTLSESVKESLNPKKLKWIEVDKEAKYKRQKVKDNNANHDWKNLMESWKRERRKMLIKIRTEELIKEEAEEMLRKAEEELSEEQSKKKLSKKDEKILRSKRSERLEQIMEQIKRKRWDEIRQQAEQKLIEEWEIEAVNS